MQKLSPRGVPQNCFLKMFAKFKGKPLRHSPFLTKSRLFLEIFLSRIATKHMTITTPVL